MAQVSLEHISKKYSSQPHQYAVDNVSLNIKNREFLVLLGPSGCGKSTTLRMIAGLEEPTKGKIFIDDQIVNDLPAKDRDISMVFQNYALYPHMRIYENMSFALRLRGYSKYDIDKRIKDVAEVLDITHLLERRPRQLSGGERQRVALGRAIMRKPRVFLFDEPLSNLDFKMRSQMRTELHKLHLKIQTTMIYVTHDQTEAMTLGNRIAVMKDGRIMQCDTPLNIYNRPANKFIAGFIGAPAMNFILGKIIRADGLYFDEGSFKIKIQDDMAKKLEDYIDKDIFFGIRPENIYDRLFASSAIPDNTVNMMCDVVETMGAQNYLHLSTDRNILIAVVDAGNIPAIGTIVEMVFDMRKAHFFNIATEEAIV